MFRRMVLCHCRVGVRASVLKRTGEKTRRRLFSFSFFSIGRAPEKTVFCFPIGARGGIFKFSFSTKFIQLIICTSDKFSGRKEINFINLFYAVNV